MKYLVITAFVLLLSCTTNNELTIKPSKPYDQVLSDIEQNRTQYNLKYTNANSIERKTVIKQAKAYLFHELTMEIFPSWYGTKWDFNGTTQVPQEGYIACGYFVTTTLRDLGLKVPRVKWAQAASETMILSATSSVKRFSNADMSQIKEWLNTEEDNIYIVGLDNHTGFVYKKGADLLFVHSSPYNKAHGVIAETLDSHSPLTVSKYRVFGKILTDEMVLKWMEQSAY